MGFVGTEGAPLPTPRLPAVLVSAVASVAAAGNGDWGLTLLTPWPSFATVQKTVPPDLQEQLKTLKTLTKEIQQEKAKVRAGLSANHLTCPSAYSVTSLGL